MAERELDREWKEWLRHNVERGCSRDELFSILVSEGFGREAAHRALNPLRIAQSRRLDAPRAEIYLAEEFLDGEECARLVALMRDHLRPSTITVADEPDKYFRRSQTCDLGLLDDPLVRAVDRRICDALGVEPWLGEPTQAQRYEIGDEFKAHTDYFEPYELEKFSTPAWGQRHWTFMVYLNEPGGGGDTTFAHLGLSIKPRTGRALVWNNLLPDGETNPDTLHHGTPVTSGSKAIITKWFRRPRSE
jgi:prolyl 4-hydroxylase